MASSSPAKTWATPTRLVVMSFAAVIAVGTALLMLPVSTATGTPAAPIDALFTATSAVCVTGLIVVNTATFWSGFGQIVILCLIQIGGLGLMTFATAYALVTGRRIGLRERMLIQEQTGSWRLAGLVALVRRIILATAVFEFMGAAILTVAFAVTRRIPFGQAISHGVFHSISAFCNAGFDILGNSLMDYHSSATVTLTVSALIIFGGLGFHVLADLWLNRGDLSKVSLHTRLVLKVTAGLLFLGMVAVLLLESTNPATLGGLSIKGKLLAAWFQSVTPRTAGFNSIATDRLLPSTAFIVIVLMFIGASPGGTGGGVKTTTFATGAGFVLSLTRSGADVNFEKRRLPAEAVTKALAILLLAMALVMTSTLILTVTESASFLDILFEVVSAFGTVGLSRGITPGLTSVGKVVIMLTMFSGRVGPLSLAMALSRKHASVIRYPEEKVTVG